MNEELENELDDDLRPEYDFLLEIPAATAEQVVQTTKSFDRGPSAPRPSPPIDRSEPQQPLAP